LHGEGHEVHGVDRRTGKDLFDPWTGPPHADAFVHLAAEASIPRVEADPVAAWRDNVDATGRALQLSHSLGVSSFVFSSSAAVYGTTQYGKQKRQAEQLIGAADGIPRRIILRLFNVIGWDPPQGGILHELVEASIDGRPASIHGSGAQRRDFVPLAAVCRAVSAALAAPTPDGLHTMDVATGSTISINELADRFGLATTHEPPRAADAATSVGATTAAAAILGFSASSAERDAVITEIIHLLGGPLGLI
jgi:UDP-glucose 4-epimerase